MLRKLLKGNLFGGIVASKRNRHEDHAAKARLQMFEAKQELEVIKQVRRGRDNRLALLVAAGSLVLVIALQSIYFSVGPGKSHLAAKGSPTPSSSSAFTLPSSRLAQSKTWNGNLTINNASLPIELDGAKAPQATSSFIYLASKGFFNNTICHRLTTSGVFIIQCGDPTGAGTGGPGYSFGPIENAPVPTAVPGQSNKAGFYPAGTIAMARRSGDAKSMGSQFFIVYKDSYFPNDSVGGYTIFGKITSGLNHLDSFIKAGVTGKQTDGKPVQPFNVNSITIQNFSSSNKGAPTPSKGN